MFTHRAARFGLMTLGLAGLGLASNTVAHAQSLLVSNLNSSGNYANTITEFGLDGSFQKTFLTLGLGSGLADTGTTPAGLAEDSAGNVYVALSSDGVILQYNPTTGASSKYATITGQLPGSVFGTAAPALVSDGTNLFVSTVPSNPNTRDGSLYKITPNSDGTTGTATKIFTDSNSTAQNIGGVTLDSAGNIYLGDGNAVSRVVELSPTGTQLAVSTRTPGGSASSGTTGIAIGPDGTVYFTEFKGDLSKFSSPFANNLTSTQIATNTAIEGSQASAGETIARPRGLVYDPTSGDLLLVDGSNGSIDRFTTAGAPAGNGGFATLTTGTAGFNSPDALLIYTPVAAAPEPSQAAALSLGILGLAGLALRARRRSAQAV